MASTLTPSEVLKKVQSDIEKKFGKDSMSRLSKPGTLSRVNNWVSSRSIVVDSVLRGGRPLGSSLVPFGRQMEISGLEKAGKTTLCAQIAAEVQKLNGTVFVIDTEERIAEKYWEALGVDNSKVAIIKAGSLSEVFDVQHAILSSLVDTGVLALLIWDSLGGTSKTDLIDPKAKESPMEQARQAFGRAAGEISRGMGVINDVVAKTNACYLYTNHMYQKMEQGYGDKWETYGGQKPKYFATVRLRLTKVGAIKESDPISGRDTIIGSKIRVKALKNSMAPQEMERDAVILGGRGFVNEYTVFEVGVKLGVIKRGGSWSTWITPKGDEIKFQGWSGFEDKVVKHKEYPALYKQVEGLM